MSDATDQQATIDALDARLATVEEERDRARRELRELQADVEASHVERDNALAVANEAIARASNADAERDGLVSRLGELDATLAERDSLRKQVVDALLAEGRRSGRLRTRRDDTGKVIESASEARLRRIGEREGLDAMRAELEEMPPAMPALGVAVFNEIDPNPKTTSGALPASVLASTAEQLEIEPGELEAHAGRITGVSR